MTAPQQHVQRANLWVREWFKEHGLDATVDECAKAAHNAGHTTYRSTIAEIRRDMRQTSGLPQEREIVNRARFVAVANKATPPAPSLPSPVVSNDGPVKLAEPESDEPMTLEEIVTQFVEDLKENGIQFDSLMVSVNKDLSAEFTCERRVVQSGKVSA